MKENKDKSLFNRYKIFIVSSILIVGGLTLGGLAVWNSDGVGSGGKNTHGNPELESDHKLIDNTGEMQYFGQALVDEETKGAADPMEIVVDELFPIILTEPLLDKDREKAYVDTMKTVEMVPYVEELEKNIDRYMDGTFSWSHESKDNLDDYLAFRGGIYYVHDLEMDARDMYEATYQKIKEGLLTINYEFTPNKETVFIHPERGGYVISGEVKIQYQSENGTSIKGIEPNKWFSFPYEVEFNFGTTNETDKWKFWSSGLDGLLLKGAEYTYEIDK